MILIIDNYDSFVYNLADYVERLGSKTDVRRNDKITLDDIKALDPLAVIISPGPCAPQQAGISIDLIRGLGAQLPILGVCLGHQAIGEAYGGQTHRAALPVHGKASYIEHDGSGLFHNLPSPMAVGRYHSLIVDLPEASPLVVTAATEAGEIMAMQHREHPVYGVQFHPESVLTPHGLDLMKNFIFLAKDWHAEQRHPS
jgi:para-aminobenzoate synthetase component II